MKTLISYSVCIAVMITALAHAFYHQGGEILAYPGLLMEALLTGFILLAVPTGDDYYSLSGSYLVFNTAFYALVIFVMLWFVTQRKEQRKRRESMRQPPSRGRSGASDASSRERASGAERR